MQTTLFRCVWILTVGAFSIAATYPMSQDSPQTTPEASAWARTSTAGEVQAFFTQLKAAEYGDRLTMEAIGETTEGREIGLISCGQPVPRRATAQACGDRLRVLITGNIHGGEVEGKEALQLLLRDVVQQADVEWLDQVALFAVPVYNPDGNEAIAPTNRVTQNGPEGGVGERANGQGLDLNRDFIKAEAPETRALLGLMARLDPHLYIDLHTTNGSDHAYHLTYAPSLSTNVDPIIDSLARTHMLPTVRDAMLQRAGWRLFDYGNYSGRDQVQWTTYDHRPRFGTNYVGLRNRFSVLSEAYSYLPFRTRVEVTYDFVAELLDYAASHAASLREACAAADERCRRGGLSLGVQTGLGEGELSEVLRGELTSVELPGLGTRHQAGDSWRAETVRVRVRFESDRQVAWPQAWVVTAGIPAVQDMLELHGVRFRVLEDSPIAAVEVFDVSEVRRAKRLFQGHHEVSVRGAWVQRTIELPVGALWIPCTQRLGRVAAQLLDPESEDSLSTWNVLDVDLGEGDPSGGRLFPVVRIMSLSDDGEGMIR